MKIILTGATGMVGEGVLLECLANKEVSEILMINRRHFDIQNPKLKELLVPDFLKLEDFRDKLKGYDACFWCAGKSSVGMNEEDYTKLTYETTVHAAKIMKEENPGMVFNFISGGHTDSTESGKVMWARVKGRAENELLRIFGKNSYNYRPALMKPTNGQKNFSGYNKLAAGWLFPVLKLFFPHLTLKQIAQAMINAVKFGNDKQILEVEDIRSLSEKSN